MFVLAALLAVAVADNAPGYGATTQSYQPQYSYDTPPKYDFTYDVHGYGDYAPQFNAQEARDGSATQGSYSVALPDGRTQTVTYRVDDAYSGLIADVTYKGEAQYPAYQPQQSYKPQQQSYKPQQSYGAASSRPTGGRY